VLLGLTLWYFGAREISIRYEVEPNSKIVIGSQREQSSPDYKKIISGMVDNCNAMIRLQNEQETTLSEIVAQLEEQTKTYDRILETLKKQH